MGYHWVNKAAYDFYMKQYKQWNPSKEGGRDWLDVGKEEWIDRTWAEGFQHGLKAGWESAVENQKKYY